MRENQKELEKIFVSVRVRPLCHQKLNLGSIVVVDKKENLISLTRDGAISRQFAFDYVFEEDAVQVRLYQKVAFPITENVLRGYNGTIFAFGPTGTGKTYTMIGDYKIHELKGIIPNTFMHIFKNISSADRETFFRVTATYLELCNEEVRDLLSENPQTKLSVEEDPDVGVYIKDLTCFTVDSIESVTSLLIRGNRNRATRSTFLNFSSSRSHTIFTITVESAANRRATVGKLNLVELASFERVSKTHTTVECFCETCNINVSLSVLGGVVSALVDTTNSNIPYKNVKLTQLLKDSLGGNSKAAMIATISGADADYEDTLSTLRYATSVKQVQNHTKVNLKNKECVKSLENELNNLQKQLEKKELKPKRSKSKVVSEDQLAKIQQQKGELLNKISVLQKKIIVGGENLIEKAQFQKFLLQSYNTEIQNLYQNQKKLEEILSESILEKVNIEERYAVLQDEDAALSEKIQQLQTMSTETKKKHTEQAHEYHREMETLVNGSRLVDRQTKLADLILDASFPKEFLQKVESNVIWNSGLQDYHLGGAVYAGNHISDKEVCQSHKFSQWLIYRRYSSETKI